ncbi:MAG TPA: ferrochelatase [Anaerolineae bacterium]
MNRVAVLMMAYGGPNTLDDVEPYLLDVRGGRPTSPEFVEEIRERYARIGGGSPLLNITVAQAQALEASLNNGHARQPGRAGGPNDVDYRVYVGMRHWYPYIREAVSHIFQDGIWQVVAFCMAPHYSKMSTDVYFQKLAEAVKELGAQPNLVPVPDWHANPLFIKALAGQVRAGLAKFAPAERDSVKIIFSAHSLPAVILDRGDPYPDELAETCRLLAAELGLTDQRWQFAYQSAGASGGRWLGPAIEDSIKDLCRAGTRNILVAPVGFVADHVEILFDLDVECRELAQSCGAHLERTESLNTSPAFIAALADIVRTSTRRLAK